jgi:hypothetical protein
VPASKPPRRTGRYCIRLSRVFTANASVNNCQNCTALAISVQTVVAAKSELAELTANDQANATMGTNCANCNTLAEAFQIVYAPACPACSSAPGRHVRPGKEPDHRHQAEEAVAAGLADEKKTSGASPTPLGRWPVRLP